MTNEKTNLLPKSLTKRMEEDIQKLAFKINVSTKLMLELVNAYQKEQAKQIFEDLENSVLTDTKLQELKKRWCE